MTIFDIIKSNDFNKLKENLKFNNINECDLDGNSMLSLAVLSGNLATVNFLLQNGINPDTLNNNGESPLHLSIRKQTLAITKALVRNNANVRLLNLYNETPLMLAIKLDRKEEVNLLREFEYHLDDDNKYHENILFYIVYSRNVSYFSTFNISINDYLCKDFKGNNLLHLSAKLGCLEITKYLIDYINPNIKNGDGETPIFLAVKEDNFEIVSFLLDKYSLITIKNKFHETILDYASLKMREFIMMKTSSYKYQSYLKDYPLHVAVLEDDYDKVISSYSIINKNKKDNLGYLAQDYARILNYQKIYKYLLNKKKH